MAEEFIGISEDKIAHSLAVARKCYQIAKEEYELTETNARKVFLLGLIHDFGYEFSVEPEDHPSVAVNILASLNKVDIDQMMFAILTHGKPARFIGTTYQAILNEADLTVDHKGNEVTMKERCDSVAERYGVDSQAHSNMVKMSQKIIEFKENNK